MPKHLPLELKWRLPHTLPDPGEEIEVAWCRFLDQTMRLTVAPVERRDLLGQHPLTSAPVPVIGRGWEVRMNGEPITRDAPTDFYDACYNAWAAFVELIPEMARHLTQALDQRSIREGWDRRRMDVYLDYAWSEEPAVPAVTTPVGRVADGDAAALDNPDRRADQGGA